MLRTVFAMAVAGLVLAAVHRTAQAAPIAPLPPGVTADVSGVTDVSRRRCWRTRWGRLHCRYVSAPSPGPSAL
jgi:hypothetical protein